MAIPAQLNLYIYQGDDYAADVTVTNADGTPANLAGYTAQSQIRTSVSDPSPAGVAQFTTLIFGNVISMTLAHDVTKDLGNASYSWDLQIIDGSGWITTLLAGRVLMGKEVTKVYA